VLLQSCLDPTLAMYRRLRDADREARLIVGPWNHTSGFNDDMPIIFGEALRWLRAHLTADGDLSPRPVRVHVGAIGAAGRWRDLADWPPTDARPVLWRLNADGTLTADSQRDDSQRDDSQRDDSQRDDSQRDDSQRDDSQRDDSGEPRDAGGSVSSFRYDPARPTPSVGGPSMDARSAGPRRNNALEARDDVLIFTSEPLREPVEVIGPVGVRLRVRGSSPHFDIFARLCDVDSGGRSWNVCDGLVRLSDGAAWTEITAAMSSTAHRFGAGHRLRVQLSGGAHPRFARNTGTGEPIATATRLARVEIEVDHGRDCVVSLPVVPALGLFHHV